MKVYSQIWYPGDTYNYDNENGYQATEIRKWFDLAEAHCADGDHRHVERIKPSHPFDDDKSGSAEP